MAPHGLQFRSEEEEPVRPAIEEWLFSKTVAAQMKLSVDAVPNCGCEHAVRAAQGFEDSPLGEGCEEHFRVGMPAKPVAPWFQVGP